jgi:hypothetical protein
MNQFASQEQALAHAQRLATELGEALREAVKGAGPAEMGTRGTIPEGSGAMSEQIDVPILKGICFKLGKPSFRFRSLTKLIELLAAPFEPEQDRRARPNKDMVDGPLVSGFVRLSEHELRSTSGIENARKDALGDDGRNILDENVHETRDSHLSVHDSSSSVGGASAVTGAGSSTSDPTEGEPPSLADLADDLSRVVEGLRRLATEEEWAKASPRRYHPGKVF